MDRAREWQITAVLVSLILGGSLVLASYLFTMPKREFRTIGVGIVQVDPDGSTKVVFPPEQPTETASWRAEALPLGPEWEEIGPAPTKTPDTPKGKGIR